MLQVGIIGFGRIGNEHSDWIRGSGNAHVAAVFDQTPARMEMARGRGLRVVHSLDLLLNDPSIDAVLISTPSSMHFNHAVAAINAGKHVMIEKPMALDLPQSQQIYGRAKERGRVLSVFHCRRWDIDYLTVKHAIASDVLGRVINVESRLGQWESCVGPAAPEFHPNWRNEASFGGGALYDWGSHFVDQLWQLMLPAKPARVFAQLRGNIWTSEVDDFARVIIDFDNGSTGLCEINTTTTRPLPRWHIDGTRGSADSPYSLRFDTHEWARLSFTGTDGTRSDIPAPQPGLSESQIWNQFAKACSGEGKPAVEIPSVLVTMTLLDAARKSSGEGRAIDVAATVSPWMEG